RRIGMCRAAAVEAAEQEQVGCPGDAHQEVTGEADPVELDTEPAADLDGEDGQRDRDPGAAVEDVVQEAVARVVVVRAIAPKAALLEEIPHEQASGFVLRWSARA